MLWFETLKRIFLILDFSESQCQETNLTLKKITILWLPYEVNPYSSIQIKLKMCNHKIESHLDHKDKSSETLRLNLNPI